MPSPSPRIEILVFCNTIVHRHEHKSNSRSNSYVCEGRQSHLKRPGFQSGFFQSGVIFFALLPLSAQAKAPAPALSVPRIQAQAFGLGYALRTADLSAVAYTQSVQSLKDVTDPKVAGAEVAHFKSEVPKLRRSQAASYTQAATLLTQMGAPPALRAWAAQSAATLNAPLVYSKDAQKLAKTEPDTAQVLAELVEIQNIKAAADARQTPLTLWLNLTGGRTAPWNADIGAYTAELRRASAAVAPTRLSSVTAQVLLRHAPSTAPAAARGALAALIPQGGGNLQNLATLAPANVTPAKITYTAETLLMLYGAAAEAEALDKSAA